MKALALLAGIGAAVLGATSSLGQPEAPVTPEEKPGLKFTLRQAEAYALQNHPQIAAAKLTADAVRQQIREARSNFFPQIYGEIDAVYAPEETRLNTRLAALGSLNNPTIYSRESDGITVSQLITDFGRTYELTEAAHYRADAAADRANVARAVVVFAVDRAYFSVLRAQAISKVAQDTVKARQIAYNQISSLARNQLKSVIDVNFAQVNLSEAQLLSIQAQSGITEAEAALSTALGFAEAQRFELVEEPVVRDLPSSPEPLIQEALRQRPELASLRNEAEAAQRFARAQVAAEYPKVTALGAAGVSPVADRKELEQTYYAAGLNVEIPAFTGGNLDAKTQEARLAARADAENLIDAQNTISRDVRIAWLDANTAYQRLQVTAELVKAANQAANLATARYRLGMSSIVELIQAQLNQTQAQLQDATAHYDYEGGRALLDFSTGTSIGGSP